MKKLPFLLAILFFVGCNNLNRAPNRWALLLDAETKEPVANRTMIYVEAQEPNIITETFLCSRYYVSDENGLIQIPLGVGMFPVTLKGQPQYEGLYEEPPMEKVDIGDKKDVEVIYLKKVPPFECDEESSSPIRPIGQDSF